MEESYDAQEADSPLPRDEEPGVTAELRDGSVSRTGTTAQYVIHQDAEHVNMMPIR